VAVFRSVNILGKGTGKVCYLEILAEEGRVRTIAKIAEIAKIAKIEGRFYELSCRDELIAGAMVSVTRNHNGQTGVRIRKLPIARRIY
jgi:hypothetical protein